MSRIGPGYFAARRRGYSYDWSNLSTTDRQTTLSGTASAASGYLQLQAPNTSTWAVQRLDAPGTQSNVSIVGEFAHSTGVYSGNGVHIAARVTDWSSLGYDAYYAGSFYQAPGWGGPSDAFSIVRMINNSATVIATAAITGLTNGARYRAQFDLNGTALRYRVWRLSDMALLHDLGGTDSQWSSGEVGIRAFAHITATSTPMQPINLTTLSVTPL